MKGLCKNDESGWCQLNHLFTPVLIWISGLHARKDTLSKHNYHQFCIRPIINIILSLNKHAHTKSKCCGTPVVVLSLSRPRIRLTDWFFLLGHQVRLPMLIKKPKILAYIICPPGDRSADQSITLYFRLILRDKSCTVHVCWASYNWPLFSSSLTTFSLLSSF